MASLASKQVLFLPSLLTYQCPCIHSLTHLLIGVRRAGRAHQGARHVEGQGGGGGDRGVRAGARGRRSLRGALIARGRWCEPLTKVVDMTLGAKSLVVSATY